MGTFVSSSPKFLHYILRTWSCLFHDLHNSSFFSFSFLYCHVCSMKLTTDLSSTTGPLHQNISPVSDVTKTSNFEMKDNQAYGVLTTSTISTPPVYEIIS